MKIAELKSGMRRIEVTGTIADISEERDVTTRTGESARVVTATLKDDSGEIKLSLWNQDIDKVKVGDSIKIENGYVTEFRQEPQLNVGRYGTLTVQT
jgi:replication factor A1